MPAVGLTPSRTVIAENVRDLQSGSSHGRRRYAAGRSSVSRLANHSRDAHDNLILCGPTGVGKSWLACTLGHKV